MFKYTYFLHLTFAKIRYNSVKWRWFIVHKKVEQTNKYLFIDTYKLNKIKWAWMKK